MNNPKLWANLGRVGLTLGLLSLIGAWIAGQTGTLFGFTQAHLFNDAIVFSLLGIGSLIDAQLHSKKV